METRKEGNNNNSWSWEQDKAFERGLAIYPENCEERWLKIAEQIPGHKTIEEVKHHYQLLLADIANIEAGNVNLPNYPDECRTSLSSNKSEINGRKPGWGKRRAQPWTEEEHKQFLMGLEKYGKGDWKSIAKEFVRTRTSTQVASHAQKHFNRQEKKEKKYVKRRSIFDITSPRNEAELKSNNNGISSTGGGVPTMFASNMGIYNIGNTNNNVTVARPVSPPSSPPLSWWCLDTDGDNVLDFAYVDFAYEDFLSQLPPL
ncbi:transcription factor DIVARICATA-like [Silene latifolia]|uniref:transcription factor DIVARICATA-like n=1 Tax=Silene latifolia TaxID=37657 RepID=UPI003D784787